MSVAAVARLLGGKKVLRKELRSESDLIAAVREGLPSAALDSVFDACADTVNTRADLYQAVGNMRTLQRKRAEHSVLSPDESDRLARLARLLVRAEEAFGDRAQAHDWMATPNRALGGARPLALLDSDIGALEVERVLGRIEHGVFT